MAAGSYLSRYSTLTFDRHGLALAALFVAVIAASVALVKPLAASGSVSPIMSGESTATTAAGGAAWALLEAAVAGVLLLLLLLWRRFPKWVREALSDGLTWGMFLLVGGIIWTAYGASAAFDAVLVTIGLRVFLKALNHYDLLWIFMNAFAIAVAILLGAMGGLAFPLPFLAVGLIGLAVYDHYFANERPWMFQLGAAMIRRRMPVLIVVPTSWRLDWEELADAMAGENENADNVLAWGIGMADIALPAMVAAALVARSSPVAIAGLPLEFWGVLVGVVLACFRLRWVMENRGGGAGLPALATGTLGGWAIGAAVVWAIAATQTTFLPLG